MVSAGPSSSSNYPSLQLFESKVLTRKAKKKTTIETLCVSCVRSFGEIDCDNIIQSKSVFFFVVP